MSFSTKLAVLALGSTLLGAASEAASERPHQKEALALLEAGGDADFFESVHEAATEIQQPVVSRLGKVPVAKLTERLKREAPQSVFRTAYIEAYGKHRSDEHRKANLAFFATPLFKKIRAAEDLSESEAGEEKLAEFMEKLEPSSVSEKRQEAIDALVNDAGTLDLALGMLDVALELQLRASNALLPPGAALTDEEIRRQVADARDVHGQRMEVLVVGDLLFTYRDLSDEEVERYAKFCTSESGQWYAELLIEGLHNGAAKAGLALSPEGRGI